MMTSWVRDHLLLLFGVWMGLAPSFISSPTYAADVPQSPHHSPLLEKALLKDLQSNQPSRQVAAAILLGDSAGNESSNVVLALLRALQSENPDLRAAAANSLLKQSPAVLYTIRKDLKAALHNSDPWVRSAAEKGLKVSEKFATSSASEIKQLRKTLKNQIKNFFGVSNVDVFRC